ncbi:ShlB/FhaC/HecB family hemolysin secretion/activation protein [Variovorax defluvii]|uniref:ShlB/FhaC/HecB family hemolysin secretion/activation protein n=1 Tax=Variovorax defluvii TaxID=913761 RepID=A0ABP8IC47_9BURK
MRSAPAHRLSTKPFLHPCLAVAFTLSAGVAQAQPTPPVDVPGAGQLQRQIEQTLQSPPPAVAPPTRAAEPAIDRSGPLLIVQQFSIEGASLIPADELARPLDSYRGKPLSLGELQAAAQALVALYRDRGWFARVLIPPQDATAGTLRVRVIEGRFGRVIPADPAPARADAAFVEAMVARGLHPGEPYAQEDLERGLLLANDLPGVRADGVLQAGTQTGTSDLALYVQDTPLFSGQVGLGNAGSRFTGRAQAHAQLALNNPSGRGDQATLTALAAESLDYLAAGYSVPLGTGGWRASLAHSELHYRLGRDFARLDARGSARTTTLGLSYPLKRSGDASVWIGLNAEQGRYNDDTLGATLRQRHVDTATLALWGQARDGWKGGGITDWRVALGHSRLALAEPVDRAQDAAGPRAAGSATRLSYELRREQNLVAPLYGRIRVAGQFASRNLDASQKMALGGPSGVRAFPADDGLGDSAHLMQLEVHRPFTWSAPGSFDGFVFLDAGLVRQHHRPWAGWDTRNGGRNNYGLAAAGAGLNWTHPTGLAASLTLAVPLGHHPGSGVSGRNQDGSRTGARVWLSLRYRF